MAKHIIKVHTQATQLNALNSFGGINGVAPTDEHINDDGDETTMVDSNDGNQV